MRRWGWGVGWGLVAAVTLSQVLLCSVCVMLSRSTKRRVEGEEVVERGRSEDGSSGEEEKGRGAATPKRKRLSSGEKARKNDGTSPSPTLLIRPHHDPPPQPQPLHVPPLPTPAPVLPCSTRLLFSFWLSQRILVT